MAAPPSHMWYVKAAGGVWGPYPETRVRAFVSEGRVRADTPISPWAEGPFAPAEVNAEFTPLFQTRAVQTGAGQRAVEPPLAAPTPAMQSFAGVAPALRAPALSTPRPSTPAASRQVASPAPQQQQGPAAVGRPLLVWAELCAPSTPAFHTALAATGPGVTIRPGLWLVQARMGAAALRNQLSRTLSEADSLLVVEAPLEHAAWFNLDPARDRDLRRLWNA